MIEWRYQLDMRQKTKSLPGRYAQLGSIDRGRYVHDRIMVSSEDETKALSRRYAKSGRIDRGCYVHSRVMVSAADETRVLLWRFAVPDRVVWERYFMVGLWFQLEMRQEHFLEAMLDLAVWSEDVMFRELREPVNKSDWRAHCFLTVVNAFYRPLENSIRESPTQHKPSL